MFHLAFTVRDLHSARNFYVNVLGATVGRMTAAWMDVFLWGAQLTLHERADEVPGASGHGVRHFGATLEWAEWESVSAVLSCSNATFITHPTVSFGGTPNEQAKLMVEDPSGNRIEVKAYRDPVAALRI
ncbi:MAG: glyoxalase [Acidobacteria bacterium]|nr:glyoxalase [Acidobacteriota bacterium]